MAVLIGLHLLAALVWVGGMFFAYLVLRPSAAAVLEGAMIPRLWYAVLRRFFAWVGAAITILLATGYLMVIGVYGGFAAVGWYVHLMHAVAWIMVALFVALVFGPYHGLRAALDEDLPEQAAASLKRVRLLVATNLTLGLLVVTVASAGRFL